MKASRGVWTTGGPSSRCEKIILHNNSHDRNIRVYMRILTTTHLTAGAWVACEGTVENLNALQEIVRGMKYGRLTTLNIPKYEHFTRKINRTYSIHVCPLWFLVFRCFGVLCFAVLGLFCHHCYSYYMTESSLTLSCNRNNSGFIPHLWKVPWVPWMYVFPVELQFLSPFPSLPLLCI